MKIFFYISALGLSCAALQACESSPTSSYDPRFSEISRRAMNAENHATSAENRAQIAEARAAQVESRLTEVECQSAIARYEAAIKEIRAQKGGDEIVPIIQGDAKRGNDYLDKLRANMNQKCRS